MPIARYQLPDGRIARFEVPEGTTPEAAQQMIANMDLSAIDGGKTTTVNDLYPQAVPSTNFQENAKLPPQSIVEPPANIIPAPQQPSIPPTQPQQPGILSRAGEDIAQAGQKAADLWKQSLSGELNPAMAGTQILAQGVNAAFALPGETAASAFNALPQSITQPIKQGVSSVATPIANAPHALAQMADKTQVGRAIGDYLANMPGADKTLGQIGDTAKAAANIALSVPAGKGFKAVASEGVSPVLTGVGSALEKSGQKAAQSKKMEFISDLIMPKATPGVREDLVGRTKEVGLNRKKVVQLTPQEQEIADTVSQIPGVKKSNSLQGNANAIQNANLDEAQSLINKLQKNDVEIPSENIAAGFSKVADELSKNPYLSGVDASKSAKTVVSNAMEFVQKNPRTASGLLQARKDFDAWVKAQKPNIFDAADAPVSVAVRQVRQAINDMVDGAVPDAHVKDSLRKQSNLYRAHENIATKAKDEAATRLGRAKDSISHAITLKNSIAGAGALAGLSATGALAPALGVLGAGALARYGAKAALGPTARKATGYALRKIGETIK